MKLNYDIRLHKPYIYIEESIHKFYLKALKLFLYVCVFAFPGTFKLLKVDLQKDGFDISRIKQDSLYFLQDGRYTPLDKTLHEDVISGKLRF